MGGEEKGGVSMGFPIRMLDQIFPKIEESAVNELARDEL